MAVVECRGLLFDLDGTLIDSGSAVEIAWKRFAEQNGLDPQEVLANCHGVRTVEVITNLGLALPTQDAAAMVESYIIDAGSTPIPGAVELLNSLPPQCWGVVTSSLTRTAWSRFNGTSLPNPAFIISAEDVAVGKPDPTGYLMGAAQLGHQPADCIVVEDALAGLAAARAAEMRCIAVETTNPADKLSDATYCVPDLRSVQLLSVTETGHASPLLRLEVGR